MGFVFVGLIVLAFDIVVAVWGYDSRPVDADRPTRWLFPIEND